MNEDLKGRALRAAAAILSEVGEPSDYDQLVATLAAAWLDGQNAGLADALAIVGEKVSA